MKKLFTATYLIKMLGLGLIIAGIAVMILAPSPSAEMPLLVGLFIFFISKENREDERSVHLKMSSTYIALILGYGIKLLTSNLFSHGILPVQLTEINHFLILVFALAIILFYIRLYFTAN